MEADPKIAARLRKARLDAGYSSAAEAAEAMGIKYQTYAAHENGARGLGRSGDTYARKFRVSLDWLISGKSPAGRAPDKINMVPIVGLAGAGPDGSVLFATGDGNFGMAQAPEGATSTTEALEVRGDSMRGLANDGWLVFYDEKESPRPEHMGEPCVCFLEDDRVLIKTPWPGSENGLFHLESFNAPMMLNIPVRYFAFVTDIKPRRSARKFIHKNPELPVEDVSVSGKRQAN